MNEDWRIPVTAEDYFAAQKKRVATEERRPVIRKASDLVGPGIDSSAVRLTDLNDQLATYNGYYSTEPGAVNAPNAGDPFVGLVFADAELGGRQEFTSLVSGNTYTRTFIRNPADPDSVSFGPWHDPEGVPAGLYTTRLEGTTLNDDVPAYCVLPQVEYLGSVETFARSENIVSILRPGQYTGYFWLRLSSNIYLESLTIEFPQGDGQVYDYVLNHPGAWGVRGPLNFYTTNDQGFVRFTAVQSETSVTTLEFHRLQITRVGDA